LRDPRFRDLVAELAAPLRGIAKDELIGEDIRQHRRLNRWRNAALGVVTTLLIGAVAAAAIAVQQRQTAIAQRDQALRNGSRALAALANTETELGSPATALRVALAAVPENLATLDRPYAREAEDALSYAMRNLRELRRIIQQGSVISVAFSLDGKLLATGCEDNTARLWEVATGKEVVAFRGHEKGVMAVAFSPDGRLLATGSDDNTARLWGVATGKEVVAFRGHEKGVMAVAFSPDGKLLASGSDDGTARLWEVASGKEIAVLRGHGGAVWSVAFSPDGKLLATGSFDDTARLWEVAMGNQIMIFGGSHEDVTKSVEVVKLPTGEEIKMSRVRQEELVKSVAFSPDGRLLAAGSQVLAIGSRENTARLWEVATGKEIVAFRGHEAAVNSVAFSPDGKRLATGSMDNTARLWPVGQDLVDLACARADGLPLSENDKKRFGIDKEWCTPEVSGALRAKLGLDKPETSAASGTAAR
jgi:WD40 repeat protein